MNPTTEHDYPLDPKYLEETIGYTFQNLKFTEAFMKINDVYHS